MFRLYEGNDGGAAYAVHLFPPSTLGDLDGYARVLAMRHDWGSDALVETHLRFETLVEAVPVYRALCRAYRAGREPSALRSLRRETAPATPMMADAGLLPT